MHNGPPEPHSGRVGLHCKADHHHFRTHYGDHVNTRLTKPDVVVIANLATPAPPAAEAPSPTKICRFSSKRGAMVPLPARFPEYPRLP